MARDSDVYDAIVAALQATGAFTEVSWGSEPLGAGPTPADDTYLAIVTHVSGEDLDDVDPVEIVRRVQFRVEVDAREQDPLARAKALDRLANVVKRAINGQSLAGLTLPPLTLIRRDQAGRPQHPGQTATLNGEFAYLVAGYDGFDDNP